MLATIHVGDVARWFAKLNPRPAVLVVIDGEPLATQRSLQAARALATQAGYGERVVANVSGRGFDWQAWKAEAASGSLFAPLRLLELRFAGKPTQDAQAALVQITQNGLPDVMLIISIGELDWAAKKAQWFNKLTQQCVVLETTAPNQQALYAWISAEFQQQGQQVNPETLAWLAERFEGNLLAAEQEIAKLGLLLPTGTLAIDAVRRAVLDVARWDPVDLSQAAMLGQTQRAVRIAQGLAAENAALPLITWILADDLRSALRARRTLDQGESARNIPRILRLSPQRSPGIMAGAQRLNASDLQRLLNQASHIDALSKGLIAGNAWQAIEQLVLATSAPARYFWMLT